MGASLAHMVASLNQLTLKSKRFLVTVVDLSLFDMA